MAIDITTPALLFPALSLLLLAYTNRFMGLAQIVRQMSRQLYDRQDEHLLRQLRSLQQRISVIKFTQAAGIASMLVCVIAMLFLFCDNEMGGRISFGVSLMFMVISLLLSLWEILLSGFALKIELDWLYQRNK